MHEQKASNGLTAQDMRDSKWDQGLLKNDFEDVFPSGPYLADIGNSTPTSAELRAEILKEQKAFQQNFTDMQGHRGEETVERTNRDDNKLLAEMLDGESEKKKKRSNDDLNLLIQLQNMQNRLNDNYDYWDNAVGVFESFFDEYSQQEIENGLHLDESGQFKDGKEYSGQELEELWKNYCAKHPEVDPNDRTNFDALQKAMDWHEEQREIAAEAKAEHRAGIEEVERLKDEGRKAEALEKADEIILEMEEREDELWNSRVNVKTLEGENLEASRSVEVVDSGYENSADNLHDEIEDSMKRLAAAQQLDDPIERLKAEKEIIDGLSERATDQLSLSDDTYHLFEPDYFKDLESTDMPSGQVAATMQNTATVNLS